MATYAATALDQAVAIEHGMDGALRRRLDIRETAQQALANFTSTPAGVLVLHLQDVVLHLERKLIGVAIGTAAPVGQPLHTALLITIKDLVAGLAGNPELAASSVIDSPASRRATNFNLSSMTEHSFHGIHSLPERGKM